MLGVGDGVLEAPAVEVLAAGLAVGDGPAAQPHQLARRGRGHGRHQETLAPGASYVSFVASCYHEQKTVAKDRQCIFKIHFSILIDCMTVMSVDMSTKYCRMYKV